ncbi:hypothetical protein ACJX0J_012543, partial [Zea mays]
WSFEGIKRGDAITSAAVVVSYAIDISKPDDIADDLWHMRLGHMHLGLTELSKRDLLKGYKVRRWIYIGNNFHI